MYIQNYQKEENKKLKNIRSKINVRYVRSIIEISNNK